MVDPIQSTNPLLPLRPVDAPGAVSRPTLPAGEARFSDFLRSAIREVDALEHKSNSAKESLVVDPNANLQEVMIATEQARVAFEFTMQARNKVIQAYEELMRLQV